MSGGCLVIKFFVTIGAVCVVAAVVSGGLKASGFEFPLVSSGWRQVLLGAVGLAFLAGGLSPEFAGPGNSGSQGGVAQDPVLETAPRSSATGSDGGATPRGPTRVPVGDQPNGLAALGDYVYVAAEAGESGGSGVTRIDARTGQPKGRAEYQGQVLGIAAGMGAVWITQGGQQVVTLLDPSTLREIESLPVPESPYELEFGDGALFVLMMSIDNDLAAVARIDVNAKKVQWTVPVPGSAGPSPSLHVTADTVWVSSDNPTAITALHPGTGRIIAQFSTQGYDALAVVGDSVFVTAQDAILRLDRRTGEELARYPVEADDVVVVGDTLVAADCRKDTLVRVNIRTGTLAPRIPVGDCPDELLVTPGALWVLNFTEGTLSRFRLE